MASKFQLNLSLSHSHRAMLDAIYARGRGPNDQAIVKMLLAALEEYWDKYHILPAPMRLINDVAPENLQAAAGDFAGVMFLPDVGAAASEPAAAGRLVAEERAGGGLTLDKQTEQEARRLERKPVVYPTRGRSAAAKGRARPKTAKR